MKRRYVTIDVFTERAFGGNPLAVVLDAQGLSSSQMQSIANEFNYSETTFVLPAAQPGNTAHVRIFTARTEVPFAGHPNIGTAVVVARELEAAGRAPIDSFTFEEAAGLVRIRLLRDGSAVVGAELTAPQPLSIGSAVSVEDTAACLSLPKTDIISTHHVPQVITVGLPFLVVELASREALRLAKPNFAAHERVLPPVGTDAVYSYCRGAADAELHARAFAPLDGSLEDPATGSATAATIALLATLRTARDSEIAWRVEQGVDMGRPSLLLGRTQKRDGIVHAVHVGGRAVTVMNGWLDVHHVRVEKGDDRAVEAMTPDDR
jgi:trans-2,3-dihydro-3-hydroxyanthranilate isomerase